jgi:hypothetical protein
VGANVTDDAGVKYAAVCVCVCELGGGGRWLGKSVLVLVDILNVLWPCSRQSCVHFFACTDADVIF